MVCEGEKTEPNYLEEIRHSKRIPSAHWTILPSELGTGPEKVVEYAERRARQGEGSSDGSRFTIRISRICSRELRIDWNKLSRTRATSVARCRYW
jgi:hypothetical protein